MILLVLALLTTMNPRDTLRFVAPSFMPYPGACDSLSLVPEQDTLVVLLERLRYPDDHWQVIDSTRTAPGDTGAFVVDLGGCSPCAFRKRARDRAGNYSCNYTVPINLPAPADPVGVAGSVVLQEPRVSPTPVRDMASVAFDVRETGRVWLDIFDVAGRHIARVFDKTLEPGTHIALIDARNLPVGVYALRINDGRQRGTRMVVLR